MRMLLTSVFGTKDHHLFLLEVDRYRGVGCHAGRISVCRECTSIVDHVVGVEVLQFLARGTDKHVVHEERMIGTSADHTDVDPVALVPAGVAIDDIDAVPGVEVVDGTFSVDTPDLDNQCVSQRSGQAMRSCDCHATCEWGSLADCGAPAL